MGSPLSPHLKPQQLPFLLPRDLDARYKILSEILSFNGQTGDFHIDGSSKTMTDINLQLKAQCLSAAEQIAAECDAALNADSTTGIAPCGEPLVQLLGRQARQLLKVCEGSGLREDEKGEALLRKRLDDLIAVAYAKFYAYPFKDLPACWRQLYTDAAILKFAVLHMSWLGPGAAAREDDKMEMEKGLDEMLKTLDLAVILAGAAGEKRGRWWIDRAFALLEDVWQAFYSSSSANPRTAKDSDNERPTKRPKTDDNPWQDKPSFSCYEPFTPPVRHPIQRVHDMSFEDFQSYMTTSYAGTKNLGPLPLIITGLSCI